MSLILKKAEKAEYKLVKALFVSAFPSEERPPFFMLRRGADKGHGDMLLAWDEDEFVGFTYLISNERTGYLFFFAINEDKRGMGYGSAVLAELRKMYEGKQIFLARESLDEAAENYAERVRRHKFYLRNGFSDLRVKIKEATVTYDVMSIGGDVAPEEYDKLMTAWCGKFIRRFVKMEMI